jgi:hypothetical protein
MDERRILIYRVRPGEVVNACKIIAKNAVSGDSCPRRISLKNTSVVFGKCDNIALSGSIAPDKPVIGKGDSNPLNEVTVAFILSGIIGPDNISLYDKMIRLP